MNKTELIGQISDRAALGRREAEAALDATIDAITSSVRGGDAVRITGFGTFKPRNRAARVGRNPQTGASVRIKASRGIAFAAGATLKSNLNSSARAAAKKAAAPARKTVAKKAAAPAKKAAAPAKKAAAPAKKAPAAKKAVVGKAPAPRKAASKAPAKTAAARKR